MCKSAQKPKTAPKNSNNEVSEDSTAKADIQILEIQTKKNQSVKSVIMPHVAHKEMEGWVKKSPESHPILPVTVTSNVAGYKQLGLPLRPSRDLCKARIRHDLADTVAQTVAAGMGLVHSLGLQRT